MEVDSGIPFIFHVQTANNVHNDGKWSKSLEAMETKVYICSLRFCKFDVIYVVWTTSTTTPSAAALWIVYLIALLAVYTYRRCSHLIVVHEFCTASDAFTLSIKCTCTCYSISMICSCCCWMCVHFCSLLLSLQSILHVATPPLPGVLF